MMNNNWRNFQPQPNLNFRNMHQKQQFVTPMIATNPLGHFLQNNLQNMGFHTSSNNFINGAYFMTAQVNCPIPMPEFNLNNNVMDNQGLNYKKAHPSSSSGGGEMGVGYGFNQRDMANIGNFVNRCVNNIGRYYNCDNNFNKNKQYHNGSYQENSNNKNKRSCNNYGNRRGNKVSKKHEMNIMKDRRENDSFSNFNNRNHRTDKSNKEKPIKENKSDLERSNNCKAQEFFLNFTLQDFPELPVPKPKQQWSFKLPQACNSLKSSYRNVSNKVQQRMNSPKAIRSCQKTNSKVLNSKNDKPSGDIIENGFVIIMESNPNSPKVNKLNSSPVSTAGFTPFRQRQRQISECSDDSFIICFTDDAADGVIEFTECSDDDSDTDDSEDSDSEDDDDEVDSIMTCKKFKDKIDKKHEKKTEENKKINHFEALSIEENISQPDSGFDDVKLKKVRFNTKPEVHVMHAWDYAYRAARKGDWENHARDRCRFKNRIDNVKETISPILDNKHREKIFKERFSAEKK